ncbi:hypothetical protein [Candidatus Poriferisodalis sp.]|uniref:hypothetical protein n=1 Tax=Candidatus Poriferisodalis sp. TaxID=3101277 RepID=UPI003B52589D
MSQDIDPVSGDNVTVTAGGKTALVIGGTGPTGPLVVDGLAERGFEVTIVHTGRHETPLIGPDVRHIHADPFDGEATGEALGGEEFDLAVVMYGRLRVLAALLAGRCGHFVSIGSVGVYRGFGSPDDLFPLGMPVPLAHDAPLVGDGEEFRKLRMIRVTEEAVFEHHPEAIHLRYPQLYGPRQPLPREWPLVRRALDRRPYVVVPDGGLTVKSQGWIANAAHATLLACDRPAAAVGGIYNVADSAALSIAQIAEIIADELGHRWELVSMPYDLAAPSRPMVGSWSTTHRVLDIGPTVRDLGYADVLEPTQAWRAAARWLAENPPERGGAIEQRLGDPFDYDAEDRLVAAWSAARRDLDAAVSEIAWRFEPNYGSAYTGNRPNPGVS